MGAAGDNATPSSRAALVFDQLERNGSRTAATASGPATAATIATLSLFRYRAICDTVLSMQSLGERAEGQGGQEGEEHQHQGHAKGQRDEHRAVGAQRALGDGDRLLPRQAAGQSE